MLLWAYVHLPKDLNLRDMSKKTDFKGTRMITVGKDNILLSRQKMTFQDIFYLELVFSVTSEKNLYDYVESHKTRIY